MDQQFLILIAGLFVGAVSGYVGSLMVLKRMSLVGDALSHVALPGVGIALLYNINPFFGAFGFLAAGIFFIWLAEKKTRLPIEALVGVLFTGSLALGFLIIPEPEMLEALFGDISRITFFDAILTISLSLFVFFVTYLIYKKLILATISEDLARVEKINIDFLNLGYLFLVSIIVALGIKAVGALLMGALVIIPAAAAKNISGSIKTYSVFSAFIGFLASFIGIIIARFAGFPVGPLIILTAAGIFLISVIIKK